ncbi:MAG: PTS sugar transporter subunit IIA [Erysipelotrichaceae bacterium]|nr:PTS sugar transporter subunit IIA [Erysipelotrichaceae bacterium]
MKGIVIVSHGYLAEGLYKTSQMFFTDQKQFTYVCMDGLDSTDTFCRKIEEKIKEVDSGDGVIILCDLLFGSPFNCAARILNEKCELISGVNLSILLEILGLRSNSEIDVDEMVKIGKEGICNFKKMARKE